MLIHITDTFERVYPSLKKPDLEDALKFLYAMKKTNIYPVKTEQLIRLFSSDISLFGQEEMNLPYQVNIEALYNSKCNKLLSDIQRNDETDTTPGLYGGLAGIGLYLLEKLDKQHDTWRVLL